MPGNKGRIDYIDIAKGIGIFVVLWVHNETGMNESGFCLGTSSTGLPLWGILIPVFFVCAGYTYRRKGDGILTAMYKRAKRLLLPYLFFNALLLLFYRNFSLWDLFGVAYSRYVLYAGDVAGNPHFLVSGNFVLWFLTSMLTAYFFFYVLVSNEKDRFVIIPAYIVLAYSMTFLPILLPWSIDTAPVLSLLMYAGYLMKNSRPKFLSEGLIPIFAGIALYALLYCLQGEVNISIRRYGISIIGYILAGACISFSTIRIAKLIEKTILGKALRIIGQHSLTIFCMEIVFIQWTNTNLLIFHSRTPQGILAITIALVGGVAMSVLFKKIPITRKILG